jgi:hypothetical protein
LGLGVRAVLLVVGPVCLALLAGCGSSGGSTPPEIRTVTVTTPDIGSAADAPSESPTTSTTPQEKVFDQAAVQDTVKRILTEDYKVDGVKDVTCPAKQEVKDASTFDCAVSVGDAVKKVTITVTGTDGAYRVGSPAS